ncbi:hypothetical protein [Caulobacter sp. B11]|uniref:hypothetical protein n=1 Tax=Caulobacter sp. B11 TaxID=2048899 RepID=UPI0011816ACB|nr:hypothetical protein [Caulobacter sp. B11]
MIVLCCGLTTGCVPIDDLRLPKDIALYESPVVTRKDADLVCIYEPHPDFLGIEFSLSGLEGLKAEVAKTCPAWNGLGLKGLLAPSYETLIVQLRNCRVIAVQRAFEGERPIDGVGVPFCTTPAKLELIRLGPEPATTWFRDQGAYRFDTE